MATAEQIAQAITDRLEGLREQIAMLEAARAALVQEPARARRRRARPATARRTQTASTPRRSATRRRPAATAPEPARTPAATATAPAPAAAKPRRRRSATPAAADKPSARSRRSAPDKPRARPTQATRDKAPAKDTLASRRRSGGLQPEALRSLLTAAPQGRSMVALAKELGVGEAKVRAHLTELERAGEVCCEGSRRTGRWRLTTDGDRA